ncbi:MAG TPA: hypothetical protein VGK73_37320 [Polyangiaceae bacterium]
MVEEARTAWSVAGFAVALAALGCSGAAEEPPASEAEWTLVHEQLPAALISVWGTAEDDVWAVGADAGDGPLVLHWDGATWTTLATGVRADLYWVHGFAGGPVFAGGTNGTIVVYEDGVFSQMSTPGTATVFGIWGTSPAALWAVGGTEGGSSGAFAWRRDGNAWVEAEGFPEELTSSKALWKVWGKDETDVWLVGTAGTALHYDGRVFEEDNVGGGESLFTVHHAGDRFAAVGGSATGILFENAGAGWEPIELSGVPLLVGVCLDEAGGGYAVGNFGTFVERKSGRWLEAKGPPTTETLHAVWADPRGGLWTVGGQVQARPFVRGALAYRGKRVPKGE